MKLVLDTNIFVGAGFNDRSSSADLIRGVRSGEHQNIWNERTRRETQKIFSKIPPLDWEDFEDLFDVTSKYSGRIKEDSFRAISDQDDRKYAALAKASGSVLVTNDSDLLDLRKQLDIEVKTPQELAREVD